jgi:hypothetical protein
LGKPNGFSRERFVVNNCRFRVFKNFVVDCTTDYNFDMDCSASASSNARCERLVSGRWELAVSNSAVGIAIRQFKNKDAWKS